MAALTSLRKALPKPLLHLSFFSPTHAPPFTTFRSAQSSIVSFSDPSKIAHILTSQTPFPAFTKYRPIYPYAFRKLGRAARPDLIHTVVNSHLSMKGLSEGFVIRFMMLYSQVGLVDSSVELFYQYLQEFGHSEKFLCAVLSGLLRNRCFDRFHEVLSDVRGRMEVKTGVKVVNLKLRAHCEEGNVGFARDLVEGKMEKEFGVLPDVNSFNVLLGAYLKGRDFEGFDRVVGEVSRRRLEGNVSTYKYRIVRFCKGGDVVRARDLLEEMVGKGVRPNAGCYNWVIYGLCRVGDLESAKMVLERMISDGFVAPCSLTYYTLFRCMVKEGEFVSALGTCKVILKRKWVPPFEAMEGLVKGLLEMSEKKEACKVVKKMKKRLKGPALESWVKIEGALPWGAKITAAQ